MPKLLMIRKRKKNSAERERQVDVSLVIFEKLSLYIYRDENYEWELFSLFLKRHGKKINRSIFWAEK